MSEGLHRPLPDGEILPQAAESPNAEPRAEIDPAAALHDLGYALCRNPRVVEFDGLYLPVDIDGVDEIRFTSYSTTGMARGHEGRDSDPALHRQLLEADEGVITASFTYPADGESGDNRCSYVFAKPSALRPSLSTFEFALLLGRSFNAINYVIGEFAVEHNYERKITPAELCVRLGREDLIPDLDRPRIFVTTGRNVLAPQGSKILGSPDVDQEHHRRIQQLLDAVRP